MKPIQSDFDKYVKKNLGTGNNEKWLNIIFNILY